MVLEAYENGYLDMKRHTSISFIEVTDKVLVDVKDKTKRYHKVYLPAINTLREYLGSKMLSEVTREVILDMQVKIKAKRSEKKSNSCMRVLNRIFNMAIEWGYVEANPVKALKLYKEAKRKVRFLSAEEETILLECLPESMKVMFRVDLHTGMRKGEILGLLWENVDLLNKLVVLDKTKSNKIREIPMTEEVYGLLLAKYRERKPSREDYVFPSADNKPYKDVAAFRKAVRLSGIQNFRFHDIRHTFASRLVMAGVDLVTVKELLGHAELSTTMIYAHLAPKHKRAAIAQLETYLGKEKEGVSESEPKIIMLPKIIGTKLAHSGKM
jgi:integrase